MGREERALTAKAITGSLAPTAVGSAITPAQTHGLQLF